MTRTGKAPISVVILTKNEADRITRCIESARFAAEIVVIDSGSSDDTCRIAESLGARVVSNTWPGDFSIQRNFADTCGKQSWIMHLDADERVSPGLAGEILRFFEERDHEVFSACRMPRREFIFGKWIDHGGWYPQYKLRMYRKGEGRWTGRVHERFEPVGEVKTFSSPLLHDSYKDIRTFLEKFNTYSTIDAEEEFDQGKRFRLLKLIFVPAERFFGRFIRHRGYRDGIHGFVLASLIGFNYFIRYLKLWEMQKRTPQGGTIKGGGKDKPDEAG